MSMEAKFAYAAGFFDGEGHIRIQKHSARGSFMLSLTAVQATPEPIEFLHSLFGGSVKKRAMSYKGKPKTMFEWRASSAQAEQALRDMWPYLIAKKDEAVVAFAFRKTFRDAHKDRSKLSEHIVVAREAMMYDLQRMRHEKREAHVD